MLLGRSLTVGGHSRPGQFNSSGMYKWVISELTFTPTQIILSVGAEIPDSGFYHKLRPSCLFPAPFSDCQETVENRDTCDPRFLLPWSIRATETDWEPRANPMWPKRLGNWAARSNDGLADRPSPQNWAGEVLVLLPLTWTPRPVWLLWVHWILLALLPLGMGYFFFF